MPLIVLFLIPLTVYSQPQSTASTAAEPEYSALLSLSPAQETVSVGEIIEVTILLSTGEAEVDGAEAVLKYNPKMLGLFSVEKGTLFEEYFPEKIDREEGKIALAGVTFSPQEKNGVLGKLVFRALEEGTTTVFFDFTPGATRGDSNVALTGAGGVDILKEVGNAQYVIE